MNERIKKLAGQAGIPSLWTVGTDKQGNPILEKFAELIVRECIAQCEKNADHEWLGAGSKLSAFNIKEHFGVEE